MALIKSLDKILEPLFAQPIEASQDKDWIDLDFIVRLTSITLLGTFALSWHLYIRQGRIFLPVSVMPVLLQVPVFMDLPILLLAIGILIWLFIRPRDHIPAYFFLLIMVFWVLQDLMRLQPYMCMYGFVLLVGAVSRHLRCHGLSALRVMVASVYFWGGFHKLNLTFVETIFPWFVRPFYNRAVMPLWANQTFLGVSLCVPVMEMLIGIFLLFPRYRKLATQLALAMLIVVLACLGPLGHNWNIIVWPWNIYLFIIEIILFLKVLPGEKEKTSPNGFLFVLSLTIFTLAPVLALFGLWSSYPAFKLYSGNTPTAEIVFAGDENLAQLPRGLAKSMAQGKLHLGDWTAKEFNTVIYPEPYIFMQGSKGLCLYLSNPGGAILIIHTAPRFYSLKSDEKTMPLCPTPQSLSAE